MLRETSAFLKFEEKNSSVPFYIFDYDWRTRKKFSNGTNSKLSYLPSENDMWMFDLIDIWFWVSISSSPPVIAWQLTLECGDSCRRCRICTTISLYYSYVHFFLTHTLISPKTSTFTSESQRHIRSFFFLVSRRLLGKSVLPSNLPNGSTSMMEFLPLMIGTTTNADTFVLIAPWTASIESSTLGITAPCAELLMRSNIEHKMRHLKTDTRLRISEMLENVF